MIGFEKFFYETRPVNCLLIALASLTGESISRWGQASIGLLAISSFVLMYWRYQYRSAVQLRRH